VSLDLSHDIDPRFGHIEHAVQRVGWVVMALLLLAALLGVFGGGPLSSATVRQSGPGYELELEYPRFGRVESDLQMELRITAPEQQADQITVVLSGDLRAKTSIRTISPQPESEAVLGDSIVYTWRVDGWERPQVIAFEYEARDWRGVDGRLDVSAGDQALGVLTFDQFLFP
jgi:hypothetical protein